MEHLVKVHPIPNAYNFTQELFNLQVLHKIRVGVCSNVRGQPMTYSNTFVRHTQVLSFDFCSLKDSSGNDYNFVIIC